MGTVIIKTYIVILLLYYKDITGILFQNDYTTVSLACHSCLYTIISLDANETCVLQAPSIPVLAFIVNRLLLSFSVFTRVLPALFLSLLLFFYMMFLFV